MEKYSSFRDAGTGIQPFLTPVPTQNSSTYLKFLGPFQLALALCRTLIIVTLLLVYAILEIPFKLLICPVPLLGPLSFSVLRFILLRAALLAVGLLWITVEVVARKRGRISSASEPWLPKKGDIIVSNWTSWIEIIWLTYRYDPIFALPVLKNDAASIAGFTSVSWITMLRNTGCTPTSGSNEYFSLRDLARLSNRPVVVFPELTTSNGRALLKFAPVFGNAKVPSKECILVMSVRCDSPTQLRPSGVLSIPSWLNPLGHIFTLCTALSFETFFSVRLLVPTSSPSSGDLLTSEFITQPTMDEISETCASLIAQMGRLKRIQQGWENKANLLQMYLTKKY